MAVQTGQKAEYSDLINWYQVFNTFISNYGGPNAAELEEDANATGISQLTVPSSGAKIQATDVTNLTAKIEEFKTDTYLKTEPDLWVSDSEAAVGVPIRPIAITSGISTTITNMEQVVCRNLATNSYDLKAYTNKNNYPKENGKNSCGVQYVKCSSGKNTCGKNTCGTCAQICSKISNTINGNGNIRNTINCTYGLNSLACSSGTCPNNCTQGANSSACTSGTYTHGYHGCGRNTYGKTIDITSTRTSVTLGSSALYSSAKISGLILDKNGNTISP